MQHFWDEYDHEIIALVVITLVIIASLWGYIWLTHDTPAQTESQVRRCMELFEDNREGCMFIVEQ